MHQGFSWISKIVRRKQLTFRLYRHIANATKRVEETKLSASHAVVKEQKKLNLFLHWHAINKTQTCRVYGPPICGLFQCVDPTWYRTSAHSVFQNNFHGAIVSVKPVLTVFTDLHKIMTSAPQPILRDLKVIIHTYKTNLNACQALRNSFFMPIINVTCNFDE